MSCCCHQAARVSVSEALIRFYKPYLKRYGDTLTVHQRYALQSILLCRTEAMGGHRFRCTSCRHEHFAWHSCNHRLCPRCGAADTAAWVARKLEERLPVDYYLVTFTLPAQLRPLCLSRGAEFYRLFFRCSSQAIKDVLADPRHLGGQCGFMGMFQSWRQDLLLHPHIHFIVPGIGLGKDGKLLKLKRKNWLARGEVFAARLRSLLLHELQRTESMASREAGRLWAIKWNCDVQGFGNGENALKYLGRYIFKGPISDTRIHKIGKRSVWIRVKDRKSRSYYSVEVEGVEFVRRYLLHALPSGFHRIRYYGFLHARGREKLNQIRRQLGATAADRLSGQEKTVSSEPPRYTCPHCGNAMISIEHRSRAPPWQRRIPELWKTRAQAA
jgi:predicted RNA-binding Zn-ribbon protein involved in translation (DUF1610 family)